MDGILNINKPIGMTSHDVVARLRKLLKQKRIGHAGTLDPAASGVLPICLGQGTRVAEYLSESGKAYQAEITLGISTDTYDSEGSITRTASVPSFTLPQLEEILLQFIGPQMQIPPRYSAIKIQGQPAYKRTRAGEAIDLPPRPITIYQLNIIQWQSPRLTLAVECSKGTYIRSLAHDLGERLGCGAHLAALVRTRSGPFSLSDSITLEQLADAIATGTVESYLHPIDQALQQYPALVLDDTTVGHVLHGNAWQPQGPHHPSDLAAARAHPPPHPTPCHYMSHDLPPTDLARVYDTNGRFLAIAEWDAGRGVWQPKKVLGNRETTNII